MSTYAGIIIKKTMNTTNCLNIKIKLTIFYSHCHSSLSSSEPLEEKLQVIFLIANFKCLVIYGQAESQFKNRLVKEYKYITSLQN